ncbi:MAG: formate dehydrogenase subunit gamma [Desulforhopalus sp.]
MDKVMRHSMTVRLTHWIIAGSGIMLVFSGFGQMPMYKRYNVVKIPGLAWSSNYEITLLLHYIAAAVFTATVVFHLSYHFRRKEFSILPKKGDLGKGIQGFLAMFGMGIEPRHEKFQAKQRIIYLVIGLTSLLLVVTGLIKSYKNMGVITLDPMFLQWTAFIHTGMGMAFMLLFLAHVAALLLKSHRPMIPSMFTGKISREYAEKHHPDWVLK